MIDELADHWWWRPGWQVGSRFYAWHVLFDDADDLHAMVDDVQGRLRPFAALEPIPHRWLHLTMAGVGHVAEVSEDHLAAVLDAVRHQLDEAPPLPVMFEQVEVFGEAVVLLPDHQLELAELLQRLRAGVRAGLASPGEPAERHDDSDFRAHVSVAYANGPAHAEPVRSALGKRPLRPADHVIREMSLIRMHRDRRQYEWEVVATAELGG